eukprot:2440968-Prorocentrum_lima.AAC.1
MFTSGSVKLTAFARFSNALKLATSVAKNLSAQSVSRVLTASGSVREEVGVPRPLARRFSPSVAFL